MTQYIRMIKATGEIEPSTLRDTPPILAADTMDVKGWRWLTVVENENLSAWQSNGDFPETVATDATTVSRNIVSVSLDNWKVRRIDALRVEAKSRIVEYVPEYLQLNMLATALKLVNKRAEGNTLTQDEEASVNSAEALWADSINPVRAACNAAEATIGEATTHADVDVAYAAVSWP